MTPRLRRLTARELTKALGRLGFSIAGIEGSHVKLRRVSPSGERQTLMVPASGDLATGTIVAIYRQLRRYVSDTEARPIFYR
ncbi:MAG TPA: type II toxin-antitoxin system HicA family toxin [Vicinamibacterales bacterium]